MIRRLLPLLLVLVIADAAVAQGRNAAPLYRKAIAAYERIPESDRDVVAAWSRNGGVPGPAVMAVLARSQSVMNYARRGSNLPYVDFDLDYSRGFDLELPHLARMREITRLMRAQAMADMGAGRSRAGAEMLAAVYRIGEHVKNDKILISSLVGAAIAREGDGAVGWGMDRGAFNAGESAMLLGALDDYSPVDPFGIGESVAMEREVAVQWLDERFHDPEGRLMADEMAEALGFDGEVCEDILGMDEEHFQSDLATYDEAMNAVAEAFALEDPEEAKAALQAIGEEVEAGEHGSLAAVMMPGFERLYDIAQKSKGMLEERRAALEAIATEQEKPEDVANAVVFYLQAIEKLNAAEQLPALRAFAADPTQALPEDLVALLDGSGEVMELLRTATSRRRCDFAPVRERAPVIAQAYAPGFRDLFRLLHVGTVRAYRSQKPEEAHERLVLATLMCGHLALDETIVSGLVAHRGLDDGAGLIRRGLEMEAFDEAERTALRKALDTVGRQDPFGYVAAIVRSREPSLLLFTGNVLSDDGLAAVKRWNGDQHLYVAVIHDTMLRASDTSEPHAVDLAPLGDILDMDAIEAARDDVARVAPFMRDKVVYEFDGPIRAIGNVPSRMRAARADLRKAAGLFRDDASVPRE